MRHRSPRGPGPMFDRHCHWAVQTLKRCTLGRPPISFFPAAWAPTTPQPLPCDPDGEGGHWKRIRSQLWVHGRTPLSPSRPVFPLPPVSLSRVSTSIPLCPWLQFPSTDREKSLPTSTPTYESCFSHMPAAPAALVSWTRIRFPPS